MDLRNLSRSAQQATKAITDPADGAVDVLAAREVRDFIDSALERYQKIGEAYMRRYHERQRGEAK